MKTLKLKTLFNDIRSTFLRHIAINALQVITIVIIARSLGPVENGQYALALLLPALLSTFLNFGVGSANVFYLAANKVSPSTVLNTSIRIALILSVVGLIVGACIIHFGSDALFPNIEKSLLWLALPIYPVMLLNTYATSILHGLQRFSELNSALLIPPIVSFLLVSIYSYNFSEEVDIRVLIGLHIIGLTLGVIVTYRHIAKNINYSCQAIDTIQYVNDSIKYGYKAHVSNLLAFINYKSDIFLVNFLINPAAAGIYVIAIHISERIWIISTAVSAVLLPRVTALAGQEQTRAELTPLMSRWVFLASLLACSLVGVLAYPIVIILFGRDYSSSINPLLFMLPGILATSSARIISNDIAARGLPEINMYTSPVVVVLNITGNLILIPLYGISGAAVATSIAYIVNLVIKLAIYRKIANVHWAELLIIKPSDIRQLMVYFDSKYEK